MKSTVRPAKTQAALFEVMEERQVTIDGTTRRMSDVYTIIATQNPVEQEGTYRLPEAQLDRFLFKISMGYPSVDEEMNILKRHQEKRNLIKLEDVKPILTIDELLQMRKKLDTVFIEESLLRYIANIVQQTRTSKAVLSRCQSTCFCSLCSMLLRHQLCWAVATL